MALTETVYAPVTGIEAMVQWKNHLVATTKWIVVGSSNGTNYSATADIAPTFENFVATSSWLCLRQVGTVREFLVVKGASNVAWAISFDPLGFTTPAVDPVTTPPTGNFTKELFNGTLFTTDGTYKWLVCAEDVAPYYAGAYAILNTGATAYSIILYAPLREGTYPAADPQPYVVSVGGGADYLRVPALSHTTNTPYKWRFASSAWAGIYFPAPALLNYLGGVFTGVIDATAENQLTGEVLPVEILAITVSAGHIGYMRDLRYVMNTLALIPNGTHLISPGSIYWVRVGDLWCRWGSTPPVL